jgi:uncharacterized protein (TIGR03067 family)
MRSTGLVLALALLLGAALPPKDDAQNDLDQLQGSWTMVLLFINGDEVAADQVKTGALVVDGGEYRPKLGANAADTTIKVDSSKTPKAIDFTHTTGPQKGTTLKGIYKIERDELTICRGLTEGEDRPTEFSAPKGSGLLLVVWKRSKTAGNEKLKAIEQELKRFDATWRFVSIEIEGNKVPEGLFAKDSLTLKGKQFTSSVGGTTTNGVFKIDPTVKPKTIDLTFTDGPGKGKSQRGIYELEGDTQRICFSKVDQPRPTEFASEPGSGQMIQVLKREKP